MMEQDVHESLKEKAEVQDLPAPEVSDAEQTSLMNRVSDRMNGSFQKMSDRKKSFLILALAIVAMIVGLVYLYILIKNFIG